MNAAVIASLLIGLFGQPPSQPPADASCPQMATALQAMMRNDTRLRDWAQLARP